MSLLKHVFLSSQVCVRRYGVPSAYHFRCSRPRPREARRFLLQRPFPPPLKPQHLRQCKYAPPDRKRARRTSFPTWLRKRGLVSKRRVERRRGFGPREPKTGPGRGGPTGDDRDVERAAGLFVGGDTRTGDSAADTLHLLLASDAAVGDGHVLLHVSSDPCKSLGCSCVDCRWNIQNKMRSRERCRDQLRRLAEASRAWRFHEHAKCIFSSSNPLPKRLISTFVLAPLQLLALSAAPRYFQKPRRRFNPFLSTFSGTTLIIPGS